jgi:serine/threonine protein phosphatase PrpC
MLLLDSILQGNHLILGNVGNSRAVLGTRAHDGSVIALQLTMGVGSEHKYRVKASSLPPPPVHRLCLPEKAIPGLARARAFDENRLDAYNGMLTSSLKPEVMTQRLSEKDEFIVLATEGVCVKAQERNSLCSLVF